MGIDITAAGKTSSEFKNTYSWKDYALYALGVGAGTSQLRYLLDDPPLEALPTFGVVPSFEPVFSLLKEIGGDHVNLLHNSQTVINHRPWPMDETLTTTAQAEGVWDMKVGALVNIVSRTMDRDESLIAETTWQLLLRGEGGFGGPRPPAMLRAKVPKDSEPMLEAEEPTLGIQALLYRLSGDINPIHSRPDVARQAGFDTPILHGLCTYGIAARVVIEGILEGDPMKMQSFSGRFVKVVYPSDTLVVRAWETGDEIIVNVDVKQRNENVLIGRMKAR